jgi:hypothetical protein
MPFLKWYHNGSTLDLQFVINLFWSIAFEKTVFLLISKENATVSIGFVFKNGAPDHTMITIVIIDHIITLHYQ